MKWNECYCLILMWNYQSGKLRGKKAMGTVFSHTVIVESRRKIQLQECRFAHIKLYKSYQVEPFYRLIKVLWKIILGKSGQLQKKNEETNGNGMFYNK